MNTKIITRESRDEVFCQLCGQNYDRAILDECPRCAHPEDFFSINEMIEMFEEGEDAWLCQAAVNADEA